jgi:hypothetical protein
MVSGTNHIGHWISVRARADRDPMGLSLSITLGDLPAGWAKTRQASWARQGAGIAGAVMVAPFALLVGAAVLRAIGLDAPYDWMSTAPAVILAAAVSLFIGIPVALAINIWPITRLGLSRRAGELEGVVAVEIAPLQLGVVLVALVVGGLFAAHLAADSYACLNGVRSAC